LAQPIPPKPFLRRPKQSASFADMGCAATLLIAAQTTSVVLN